MCIRDSHNAVLLVGDFFQDTLKRRAIDPAATFPPSRQPVLPATPTDPDRWDEDGGGEPGGDWLEGPGRAPVPPVNSVDEPALSSNAPKTSSELDVLLKLDSAQVLYTDR